MADETDVENTLVGLITGYLYPNGTSQASAATPTPPKGIQVFRGWPSVQAQEAAKGTLLSNGTYTGQFVNVSVAARNGVETNTSRYPFTFQTVTPPTHTLTASVTNNVVTLGGTVAVPQNVLVLVGTVGFDNDIFNYAVQNTDTLSSITSAVTALIAAKYPGTSSSGSVITIHTGKSVIARIASSGTVIQEVARQKKSFQITVWAPPASAGLDPDAWRTSVAKVIDANLKSLVRIVMPDQVYAHIMFERTITMDAAQMDGLYRRDLYFFVEFATTITQTGYEIGVFQTQTTPILITNPSEDLSTKGQNLATPPAGSQTTTTNS